jgi:hypothetical protein
MDPKAASDLTNAIKMFDAVIDEVDSVNGIQMLNFINSACGFRDALKSILGIKQNDNQFEQIEHSGSSSNL